MSDQWDREIEAILQDENNGWLTHAEAMTLIRDVERDRRDAAHEAAHEAYSRELENW